MLCHPVCPGQRTITKADWSPFRPPRPACWLYSQVFLGSPEYNHYCSPQKIPAILTNAHSQTDIWDISHPIPAHLVLTSSRHALNYHTEFQQVCTMERSSPPPPKKKTTLRRSCLKKGYNIWKEWPDFNQNDLFLAQLSSMTSLPSLPDNTANANVMCWTNTVSLRKKYFPRNDKPWPVSQQWIDKCCSSTTKSAGNWLKPNWGDVICT